MNDFLLFLSIVSSCITAYLLYRSSLLLKRKDSITLIYDELYSKFFYVNVKGVVHKIIKELNELDGEELYCYQKAIVNSWVSSILGRENTENDKLESKYKYFLAKHVHLIDECYGLTEHQALTIFLRKWVKIYYMIDMGTIKDEELAYILDVYQYDYNKLNLIKCLFSDKNVFKGREPFTIRIIENLNIKMKDLISATSLK